MEIMKKFLNIFRPSEINPPRRDIAHRAKLDDLQATIGYKFTDEKLLLKALKHRSYVYTKDESVMESNERLEFLGDAVLSLVVSECLYRMFPDQREGELTRIKSVVVSKSILSKKAHQMDLGKYLLLSQPEKLAGGRNRPSITGDAYEALLGAIFLDGGLKAASRFIEAQLSNDIRRIASNRDHQNHKSILLEYTQKNKKGQPSYILKSEEGPDHRRQFTMDVTIGGKKYGQGAGRNKKQAQQMAAKDALKRLSVGLPNKEHKG